MLLWKGINSNFNDSYKYAYFDDISGIVTDEFPDDTIVSTLERAGVKLF